MMSPLGVEVVLSDALEDGKVLAMQDPRMILVGTRRRSWAHDEAIRIVRTGLADTCRWLGIPEREPTHEDILRHFSSAQSPDTRWSDHATIAAPRAS